MHSWFQQYSVKTSNAQSRPAILNGSNSAQSRPAILNGSNSAQSRPAILNNLYHYPAIS